MRFRDAIALNTCPLLLRVGLAATFLWLGIPKFDTITFKGDAANTLVELGIGEKTIIAGQPPVETPAEVKQEAEPTNGGPPAGNESPDSAQPAEENPSSEALPVEAQGDQHDEAAPQPVEGPAEPVAGAPAEPTIEQPAGPVAQEIGEKAAANVEYTVKARQVEHITIMLHAAGHPRPQLFAWVAMFTEVVGGGLILIGLFSRIWGLGLAVAMGYAFALTTLPAIQAHVNASTGFLAAFAATDFSVQTGAFFQLMLLIAAWCIFIGGPGAASLDRLIFRRGDLDE